LQYEEYGNAKYLGNHLIKAVKEDITTVDIRQSTKTIADGAFGYCIGLTSVTIPNGVVSIGDRAFSGCSNLKSITIPDSVISIGNEAFFGCENLQYEEYGNALYLNNHLIAAVSEDITATYIKAGTKTIASYAFGGGNLKNIIIPDGVTGIGGYAFAGENFKSVLIPSSVIKIGAGAFAYNNSLTSIKVGSGNKTYHSSGNCLIETKTKTLILGCSNSIIPTDGSVTSIGDIAFDGCSKLTSINIPNGVTSIGMGAFAGSGLKSITIPDSVTKIDEGAFNECDITSIKVGSGNKTYHSSGNCLIETKIKTLILGCSNSVIPTDGSVISIGDWAFVGCRGLKSITIPGKVISIGFEAFCGCEDLTNVTIENGVTIINGCAFYGCSGLTSIIIPKSVTSLGGHVFGDCSNLTVYAEAESKPNGWKKDWNEIGYGEGEERVPVVWGI
ncbi:MAG: leucine-rich repeat domain-containing protein, partial [Acidaminococcus sp.]|nr:leucine-rich repeat domain-containing protein [Acidaminococcus sp.]